MSSLSSGVHDAQEPSAAVVRIKDVSLSYGKTRALDAVSLGCVDKSWYPDHCGCEVEEGFV